MNLNEFKSSNVIVTGAAGFIGSHLSEKLLDLGANVIGIDCLTPYYDIHKKKNNLGNLINKKSFVYLNYDLSNREFRIPTEHIDFIFHLAGQPGVRLSWGSDFSLYSKNNIEATQNLLEYSMTLKGLKKIIYASSSSIYGNIEIDKIDENSLPKPFSPYGVSKLAGENLVYAYFKNFKLPANSARFFTVYGPRQRPDMAFQRLIEAGIYNQKFILYGDGRQQRDFTYVEDIIEGVLRLALVQNIGEVVNIGGGHVVSMNEVIKTVEEILNKELLVERSETQKGDVIRTSADVSKLEKITGYIPQTSLRQGLIKQVEFTTNYMSKHEYY